jgi:A/G-specific adenine glycosylase
VSQVWDALLGWYARAGRADLPWRLRRDPYYTVVSEFMLQQTQVDRVVPAFDAFVERFPDFEALARASVADVVRAWKGLGYNSRAVRLKHLADAVVNQYGGAMPHDPEGLRALPGIGPYTAAAVRAFAYDEDVAACDVNVRRVVHRLFLGIEWPARESPRDLDARALSIVPPDRAHDWNSAMMDLGATVCTARAPKCGECPLATSCVATPVDAVALEAARKTHARVASSQESLRFKETTRYARGRVVDRLRELPPERAISLLDLHRDLADALPGRSPEHLATIISALVRDGLVEGDEAFRLRS